MLLFHLFDGPNLPAQTCDLRKFLLDSLQPFLPLAVRHLSMRLVSSPTPILLVQHSNFSNLFPQTRDLVPQNFEVIHAIKNTVSGLLALVAGTAQ
jgi:hypothetical protein